MITRRRPIFFILCAMLAIPLLFQNCGESFTIGEGLSLQGKGNGGNGGGYDGKPGTYVLADYGNECTAGVVAGSLRVKQAVVVDEAGSMSLTVRDCAVLPVPEPVVSSDIVVNAKSVSAFVLRGRLFQMADVSSSLSVLRRDISQYFCTWNKGSGLRGEFLLKEVTVPVSGGGGGGSSGGGSSGAVGGSDELSAPSAAEPATATELVASLYEDSAENTGGVTNVAAFDNTPATPSSETPDPYLKGVQRVFESKASASVDFSVMALFFADKAAQGVDVTIKGQSQSGSRCWMSY